MFLGAETSITSLRFHSPENRSQYYFQLAQQTTQIKEEIFASSNIKVFLAFAPYKTLESRLKTFVHNKLTDLATCN